MKQAAWIVCGLSVIIGWNVLAILGDNKSIDIQYRTVHQLYCVEHPQHHHCK